MRKEGHVCENLYLHFLMYSSHLVYAWTSKWAANPILKFRIVLPIPWCLNTEWKTSIWWKQDAQKSVKHTMRQRDSTLWYAIRESSTVCSKNGDGERRGMCLNQTGTWDKWNWTIPKPMQNSIRYLENFVVNRAWKQMYPAVVVNHSFYFCSWVSRKRMKKMVTILKWIGNATQITLFNATTPSVKMYVQRKASLMKKISWLTNELNEPIHCYCFGFSAFTRHIDIRFARVSYAST